MRQCCGPARGFVMHITDNNNQVCSFHVFYFANTALFPTLNLSNPPVVENLSQETEIEGV